MIDIEDLTSWLADPNEPGVTELLTNLELMAVELVQDSTGRYFGSEITHTEYIIGDGTRSLRLGENVTAITSVGSRLNVGDSFEAITEGDSDGFEIRAPRRDPGRATLLRKNGLAWSRGYEHRVIYEFGYATDAEPKRIRQAVKDLVALKYHGRGLEGLKDFEAHGVKRSTIFEDNDILAVAGLSQTLRHWRIRAMVLQ